jgi:hypothetical protein
VDREPRISVNKLAELLVTSNPVRRRKIVQDQKYPNTSVVTRYRQAYEPICEYLSKGRDPALINDAVARLRNDRAGSEWAIDDRWNTADALERFLEIADLLPNEDGEQYQAGDPQPPRLAVAGVDISVRPDFLISFTRRGKKYKGAIKLHFVKNPDSALTRAGSEYVAALMVRWLEVYGPDGAIPDPAHCLCIDVFRGAVTPASRSSTRRMTEVTAACEDIAARWPHL